MDPEGDPPEIHKNLGVLSNTGPDPLKNRKATMPEFNVGPSLARLGSSLLSSTKQITLSKLDPHDKSFWIRACCEYPRFFYINNVYFIFYTEGL